MTELSLPAARRGLFAGLDGRRLILALGLASAALIAGAWWFQLGMGLVPCKLCLQQRLPHYLAIALAAPAAAFARGPRLALAALLVLAALMLWSAGLGAYHAGVEWGWFAGPNDCGGGAGAAPAGIADFRAQLTGLRVVSCTEAAWRFLGLSLAGWNALASLALAAAALAGALRERARG